MNRDKVQELIFWNFVQNQSKFVPSSVQKNFEEKPKIFTR